MAPPPNGPPKHSIDSVARLLDRTAFSPIGSVLLALLHYSRARDVAGPALRFMDHIYAPEQRYLKYLLLFVLLKTANRALNRLAMNNGWRSDKPKFSLVKGQGDVLVITGGSTGIGKDFVEILSKKSGNIAVLDLAEPTYKAKNVTFYQCDVTDPAAIKVVADKIRKELGEPSIMINNAGIARGKTILATTPFEFLLTYKVNTLGIHNMLREFLPHIVKTNRGHVMNVASSASYMSIASLSEYSCSKAAALALHETLNQELVHRYNANNVRTSVICPTKVSTQMGDSMAETSSQFLTPTLSSPWLASQMVDIVCSGLSAHLVAPGFAALVLPYMRAGPEWLRTVVNVVGKTNQTITEAGNLEQNKVYKIVDQLDKLHRQ